MSTALTKALVLTVLRHAEDYPWRMQDIGLMSLRLDDERQCRLHVWDPTFNAGDPPVHDHPYDFVSKIIVGQLTNIRYETEPAGDEYIRFRYRPGAEHERLSDTVRLSAMPTVFAEGDEYCQLHHELHASWQEPGTVTAIQCSWTEPSDLTVCLRDADSWRSANAREASREEVKTMAAKALEWF